MNHFSLVFKSFIEKYFKFKGFFFGKQILGDISRKQ